MATNVSLSRSTVQFKRAYYFNQIKGYIMKLHDRVKHQKELLSMYSAWLDELSYHLSTPKFHVDTTIQVSDIQLRISEIKINLFNAGIAD